MLLVKSRQHLLTRPNMHWDFKLLRPAGESELGKSILARNANYHGNAKSREVSLFFLSITIRPKRMLHTASSKKLHHH